MVATPTALAWIDPSLLTDPEPLLASVMPEPPPYGGQQIDLQHGNIVPKEAGMADTMEIVGAWHVWLASSYSPSTRKTYTKAVGLFFQHHPVPVGQINEEHLSAWLQGYPFRSASRRTYYQAIRSFLRFAKRRGAIHTDPSAHIRMPAVLEKVPRALTLEEVTRLAVAGSAKHPKRGLTILLLYYTGARLNEAVNLRWDDVSEAGLRIREGKGGKERIVRMHVHLRETLEFLREYEEGPYIIGRSAGTVWGWVKHAGDEAGIPQCHPHLMRSSMATHMLQKGGRPHAVKNVLGHSSIRTTQRYWAVEREDEEAALALL